MCVLAGICLGFRQFSTFCAMATLNPSIQAPLCPSCTKTSCQPRGSKNREVVEVGRLGPGPKAAVTWTWEQRLFLGSVCSVCCGCAQPTERGSIRMVAPLETDPIHSKCAKKLNSAIVPFCRRVLSLVLIFLDAKFVLDAKTKSEKKIASVKNCV